ncbi:MAG: protein kinase, partial [Gemmatimonadales bacterium]
MVSNRDTTIASDPLREHQLEELFAYYVDRLNEGEELNPQEILAKHPGLGAELLEYLEGYIDPDAAPTMPSDRTLGDYTIRRQIGRGGMGVVYDAWQNSLDRRVALKVLPLGIAASDRAFERFMREARTAAKLDHQNIVRVHGMGVEANTPYYSMEHVEGQTLAQILSLLRTDLDVVTDTPFAPAKDRGADYAGIARAFAEVANGLQHAHEKGVIHRDIKPSNLILAVDGHLRILDFGLARFEGEKSLTLTGDLLGTPMYMSPEQARRRQIPVDHRTDIYSLGATLYEVLTHRPPFQGEDHRDTLSQIIEQDPQPLRRVDPAIPRDLGTIVLKCLRKNARDRYDTAQALAEDLRRFAQGEPVEARPLPPWAGVTRRAWKYSPRIGVIVMAATLIFLLVSLLMPTEGMVIRQVWSPALDTLGGVSPDGRYLSFVQWNTGNLALRNLTTGENRDLTNKGSWVDSNEFAEASRVSPDGKQIAYAWFNENFYDLRLIGLDGSEPRVLFADDEVAYLEPEAWSPDGKHILVLLSKKDKTNQIVLISSENGSVRVLKTFDWRYPLNMSISPDGRYVAYDFPQEENSSRRDIFLIAIDGSGEIPLIKHAGDDLLPVWAPDGNRIVFGSDRTGAMALWALQVVDGKPQGSPELIKKDMGRFYPIGFTPNSSFYYSLQSGMPDVYTATLDLGTGKFLAPATPVAQRFVGTNFTPDFSPDGKNLLYLSQRGRSASGAGSRVLVIHSLESGEERVLSPKLPFHRVHTVPRWSPDGRSILVTSRDLKGGQGCYRIDSQTGEFTSIVQRTPSIGGKLILAVWSADGKAIIFQRGASIVVRDIDSGQEKVLYSSNHIHAWALSQDGRQLALTVPSKDQANNTTPANSNVLLVMPATGGQAKELFRVPAKEEITAVVWTADGRQLLFCKVSGPRNMEEELWRIPADGGKPQPLALDLTAKQLALLRFHPDDGTRVAFTA